MVYNRWSGSHFRWLSRTHRRGPHPIRELPFFPAFQVVILTEMVIRKPPLWHLWQAFQGLPPKQRKGGVGSGLTQTGHRETAETVLVLPVSTPHLRVDCWDSCRALAKRYQVQDSPVLMSAPFFDDGIDTRINAVKAAKWFAKLLFRNNCIANFTVHSSSPAVALVGSLSKGTESSQYRPEWADRTRLFLVGLKSPGSIDSPHSHTTKLMSDFYVLLSSLVA